jgi:hypothetical protein
MAVSLNNLGGMRLAQDRPAEARALFRESLDLLRELHDPRATAECLAGLAAVAASDRPARAARLFAAAASLRQAHGCAPSAAETAVEERCLPALRAALGETAFTDAWNTGQAWSMEEALAAARELS